VVASFATDEKKRPRELFAGRGRAGALKASGKLPEACQNLRPEDLGQRRECAPFAITLLFRGNSSSEKTM
jgi:hypothetical protein